MTLLKIKPYREKKAGYCGPATLKMVLGYYGLNKTEEELAKITQTTPGEGMKVDNAKKALLELGFNVEIKDFASLDDIKGFIEKRLPVVVDWFSTDDGHYSVVVGLDDHNIYLQDPELSEVRKMEKKTFKRVWFDFQGKYLKSKDDLIIRRIIVIQPA